MVSLASMNITYTSPSPEKTDEPALKTEAHTHSPATENREHLKHIRLRNVWVLTKSRFATETHWMVEHSCVCWTDSSCLFFYLFLPVWTVRVLGRPDDGEEISLWGNNTGSLALWTAKGWRGNLDREGWGEREGSGKGWKREREKRERHLEWETKISGV